MEPLGENGTTSSYIEVDGQKTHEGSNSLTVSKGSEEKSADTTKQFKAQKYQEKSKNEKLSNPKRVAATWVKKKKDGKKSEETSAALNDSFTSSSHLKQLRRSIQGNAAPTRSLSVPSTARLQQSGKSGLASSAMKISESEGLKEHTGHPKPLKQGSGNKVRENTHSAPLDPTTDRRSQRVSNLPSYSINFKCDERAERRKAFYSKLEEKTHAKEAERNTLQAKSQETQEAEIKLLRKNLAFKATLMPSFYQESAPPKVELKKIPPTRARSPKLGRRKSAPSTNYEGNNNPNCGSRRLSVGEEVPRTILAKGSSTQHSKKPLRKKSLSKQSSEKSTLANPTEDATTLAPLSEQEPSTSEPNNESAPSAEEQAQLSPEQEEPVKDPISSQHRSE